KAFEKLPELLDNIIAGAETLMQTAESASTKIHQMLVDDEGETSTEEECEEPDEPWYTGRSRLRVYTMKDAIRAHRQYFIDLGVFESALSRLSIDGWKEDGRRGFVSLDPHGKVRCSVKFIDDDGSAEVTFADGESEQVSIDE